VPRTQLRLADVGLRDGARRGLLRCNFATTQKSITPSTTQVLVLNTIASTTDTAVDICCCVLLVGVWVVCLPCVVARTSAKKGRFERECFGGKVASVAGSGGTAVHATGTCVACSA
jgi:hypothetical protein